MDELIQIIPGLIQTLDEISADEGWASPEGAPVVVNCRYSMLLAA